MATATFDRNRQLTIPKSIIDQVRWEPGDTVSVTVEGDRVVLTRGAAPTTALSERERQAIVATIVGSHAIEGVDMDPEMVDELVDEVFNEPPVDLR